MLGRAPYFKAMIRRYALRDDQWERIKDLLSGRQSHEGVTAGNNRLFVEAVLYRNRAVKRITKPMPNFKSFQSTK